MNVVRLNPDVAAVVPDWEVVNRALRALAGIIKERYEDVLQNIEFAIVNVYREHPDLLDSHVDEEIVACLKRIRKSVGRWNKRGGRQGCLTFIQQYIL